MAQQEARRFIAEFKGNKVLADKVKEAAPTAEYEPMVILYTRIAKDLGFDFTPEELEAEIRAQQAAVRASMEVAELSDEELDQVAGGVGFSHNPCTDTYTYNEWCWLSDWCQDSVNQYR